MQIPTVQSHPSAAPVQNPPAPPVAGRDNDGDNDHGSGADDKVKAANPAGVGNLLDVNA